jgi:hypothetical protein
VTLVESIRAYAAELGIPVSKVGRDGFRAWRIAKGDGFPREMTAMWSLAKAEAYEQEDERPEPKSEASVKHGRFAAAEDGPAVHEDPVPRRSPPQRAVGFSEGPDRVRKLLIIPDAHAHPQYSNERFEWLGKLIAEERPELVVCLGDFADMPALSQYDKGKRGFEGRRYTRDVEATQDALARMHRHVTHGPELVMCLGNHEARIDRATSDCAELEGAIQVDDLGYRDHGWRVVPYMSAVTVGGFAVSHHFASGVAGRPIGGMTMAASMARLLFTSAIVGHSHTLDWARRTRPDGSRVVTLVPGCYTAPEQGEESWCRATSHLWWRGVAVLEDVEAGDFGSLRLVSQDSMRERYAIGRAA